MKKIIVAVALMGISAGAFAEAPGGPSCGWGNMLFKGQSGLPQHMFALTTNGTSGNATFGMTSGTNGCSVNGKLTYGGQSLISMSAVFEEFTADAARGDGEALNAVALSLGIEKQDRSAFAEFVHSNFATLYPTADVTPLDVHSKLITLMKSDDRFAKYVG